MININLTTNPIRKDIQLLQIQTVNKDKILYTERLYRKIRAFTRSYKTILSKRNYKIEKISKITRKPILQPRKKR